MASYNSGWLILVGILVTLSLPYSHAFWGNENKIHTAVFLSPEFVLGPGSVENRFYFNVDFPKGHIALKSFDAEVIDEAGYPVPLHETYLHHWVVVRYYVRKGVEISKLDDLKKLNRSDYISGGNSGICQNGILSQFFGLGSETRKTSTHIPDPYGIEVGNPAEVPSGFQEQWMLNVHAIDTRGAEDKLGCTECRCDLYNVTVDEYGRPLRPYYKGGLLCCYDRTQCKVKHGFEAVRRTLYLRYTVKWIDMDRSVLPVKIYIFDITDSWKRTPSSTEINAEHKCKIEYDIESCDATGLGNDGCIDTKRISLDMPFGGYLIYGVAHQHSGGTGSALYREDGQLMCSSLPTYGEGEEPGNEAGYIVGMTTCYPKPGTVEISEGEILIRQRIVKIQAHVRGHQVRKQYKTFVWSVGILEKVILRWRRKGSGLRGFRRDAIIKPDPQCTPPEEDEYDFLKEGRKQTEERFQKALTRVKSMAQNSEGRGQYRRLLTLVQGIQENKACNMVLNSTEEVAVADEDFLDVDSLLDDDTFMSIAFE